MLCYQLMSQWDFEILLLGSHCKGLMTLSYERRHRYTVSAIYSHYAISDEADILHTKVIRQI